jgi:hypothetical protein
MVDVIEEAPNVRIHHKIDPAAHHNPLHFADSLVTALTLPKSVRKIIEFSLVDLVEYTPHHALHQTVFIGRYTQRA